MAGGHHDTAAVLSWQRYRNILLKTRGWLLRNLIDDRQAGEVNGDKFILRGYVVQLSVRNSKVLLYTNNQNSMASSKHSDGLRINSKSHVLVVVSREPLARAQGLLTNLTAAITSNTAIWL